MGRRKISIAPIKDDRNRQVTFLKRKNGLFKKAYELGVLCSADVAIIVFNANGKLFEFHSGDLDQTLLRYSNYAGPAHEKRGPEDYLNQDLAARGKRGSGQSDEAEEEEESDEEKPHVAAGSSGVRVIPHVNKGKQALRSSIDRKTKMEEMGSSFDGDQRGDSLPGAASLFDLANGIDGGHGAHASTSNGFQALPSINLSGFGFMPPNTLPGMQQPQQSQQANGGQMMPQGFSSAPMPFPNFSAPGAQAPSYGFAMPGTAAWSGVLGQQQQAFPMANGSGVSASGVPAWFGMSDPNSAAFQSARDQLAQLPPMQLLQHLGGMSAQLSGGAWAGLGGNAASEAAMQALQAQQQLFQQQQQQQQHQQQQHQHQHQHPHQQHQHQQHQHEPQQPHAQPPPDRHDHHAHAQQPAERSYSAHEPSPRSQPAVLQPHRGSPSFHPTPAPMYGSPASMLPQATPGSSHHHTPSSYTAPPPDNHDHDIARPESSASFRSSHTSPAGRPPPRHQSSTDSYGYDRPKLQVAIPADADPNEHTKAGLVTAGGASILGAGFHQRDSHLRGQPLPEQEGVADVHENGVERTAFASELLPSPFYPGGPYAAAAAFAWPTTDGHQEAAAVMATGPDVRERQDSGLDGMRRESDDSGGAASNGSKGLDDLSQAAQALANVADEAGSSAIGPGRRERPDGEDGLPYDGQSKRRRV